MAFAPGGSRVAYSTLDHSGDPKVCVMLAAGEQIACGAAGRAGADCVAFDPNGERLSAACGDWVVRVYDLKPVSKGKHGSSRRPTSRRTKC